MSFKKGCIPWIKGRTKETDEKVRSAGQKGSKTIRKQFENGRVGNNTGRKFTTEWIENLSASHVGIIAGMTGKHHTQETKDKLMLARRGKKLTEEHKLKIGLSEIGEKHWNWQGGKSFEIYSKEFNKDLKEQIRKRDNYECQNCSMTQEEHYIVYGRDIEVHHIDYNRENCKEDNLITTCKQCNIRANKNKIYWQDYYKQKIKAKETENVIYE